MSRTLIALTALLFTNCLPSFAQGDAAPTSSQLAQEKLDRDRLEQALQPARGLLRADISIQPIASDEPIVQAGFPPLPDRIDLPATALIHKPYEHYHPTLFLTPSGGRSKNKELRMPVGDFDRLSNPTYPSRI